MEYWTTFFTSEVQKKNLTTRDKGYWCVYGLGGRTLAGWLAYQNGHWDCQNLWQAGKHPGYLPAEDLYYSIRSPKLQIQLRESSSNNNNFAMLANLTA